jgi:hypothetical protein
MPSTLYSQSDSLYCLTVKQQNDNIAKLIHRLELIKENKNFIRLNQKNDSIIAVQDGTISDLKHQNELSGIIYQQEQKTRLNAEKEAKKFKRRTKFWKGSTVVLGLTSIGLYIFR